jgi:hypothetical protein
MNTFEKMIAQKSTWLWLFLCYAVLFGVVAPSVFAGSTNNYTSASYTTSKSAAQSSANGYNNFSKSVGKNYSYSVKSTYSSSKGWGYTVQQNNTSSDSDSDSYNGPNKAAPKPCHNQNLLAVDIFFVPAGTQPAAAKNTTNPYQHFIVPAQALEVGKSYEPIAQIRNNGACSLFDLLFGYETGGNTTDQTQPRYSLRDLIGVPTAHAIGNIAGPTPQSSTYPNNIRSQLPFGTSGSFPIRVRIDFGNNGSIDWEHYLNAQGPVPRGATRYIRLPAFSSNEVGTHSIAVVTDIRHSVDAGRGCYAPSNPTSAGWGCIRETNENDNDRVESFTTSTGGPGTQLGVMVSDVTVNAGDTLTQVPFTTRNNGTTVILDYTYRVTIGGATFASTSRTTNLAPAAQELVTSTGSYTAPNNTTTLPLTVCAIHGTSTPACDTALVNVVTPECSDAQDNDSDTFQDSTDPGCFTDPLDPSTYDPDDDNEGDVATTSPSVVIEFRPVVNPVRYDTSATLEYEITGPAPMSCQVTGGGANTAVNHTPSTTSGQVTTGPVRGTQQFTMRCTATVGGVTVQFERTTTVDVIPLAQET